MIIPNYSAGKILGLKPGTMILLAGEYAVIVKTQMLAGVRIKAHKENCKNPYWYGYEKVSIIFTDPVVHMRSEFLKLIKKYKK